MSRHHGSGRGVSDLLADFGHDLPRLTAEPQSVKEADLFPRLHPARGVRRPGHGWAPATAPLAQWRMTSEQAPVFWPLISSGGLPPTGASMGFDWGSGGSHYCDPHGWVLDDDIPVTNPNIFIFGKPGRGKSGTCKCFCLRMADFGYRTLILGDTKDEYEDLCRYLGVEPFVIGPGQSARVNPLSLGPLGQGWDRLDAAETQRRGAIIFGRWLTLVRGLVGSQRIDDRRVPFTPTDEKVVSEALRDLTGHSTGNTHLREVTIPELWRSLDEPHPGLVARCRYADRQHFWDDTRLLRDALAQLVSGHLAGLFDAPTTIDVDWQAPIQSMSLSRLEPLGDDATAIALTCLSSWGRAQREVAEPGDFRIVLRDEAWRQMRVGVEAVKSLDADLRLSRRDGDVQVVVCHKPSDPMSAGDLGSQAVAIAKDLLHLADIKVLHGQDAGVAKELEELLELGPMAQNLVSGWAMAGKGRALWLVGDLRFQVETILSPIERELTMTNQALQPA